MPRPKLSDKQRQAMRTKIRAAAQSIWRMKGLESVTIRNLAVACGYSVPTIYAYFQNRQEIIRSLWLETGDWFADQALAIERRKVPPLQKIQALIQAYADFAFTRPDEFRITFLLVDEKVSDMAVVISDLDTMAPFRVLRESIALGMCDGTISVGDAHALAVAVWASIHGAIALPINLRSFELGEPKAIVAKTEALILSALGASAKPPTKRRIATKPKRRA